MHTLVLCKNKVKVQVNGPVFVLIEIALLFNAYFGIRSYFICWKRIEFNLWQWWNFHFNFYRKCWWNPIKLLSFSLILNLKQCKQHISPLNIWQEIRFYWNSNFWICSILNVKDALLRLFTVVWHYPHSKRFDTFKIVDGKLNANPNDKYAQNQKFS